jgi:hypothetical protein
VARNGEKRKQQVKLLVKGAIAGKALFKSGNAIEKLEFKPIKEVHPVLYEPSTQETTMKLTPMGVHSSEEEPEPAPRAPALTTRQRLLSQYTTEPAAPAKPLSAPEKLQETGQGARQREQQRDGTGKPPAGPKQADQWRPYKIKGDAHERALRGYANEKRMKLSDAALELWREEADAADVEATKKEVAPSQPDKPATVVKRTGLQGAWKAGPPKLPGTVQVKSNDASASNVQHKLITTHGADADVIEGGEEPDPDKINLRITESENSF